MLRLTLGSHEIRFSLCYFKEFMMGSRGTSEYRYLDPQVFKLLPPGRFEHLSTDIGNRGRFTAVT